MNERARTDLVHAPADGDGQYFPYDDLIKFGGLLEGRVMGRIFEPH